jgi:hypothetical protein
METPFFLSFPLCLTVLRLAFSLDYSIVLRHSLLIAILTYFTTNVCRLLILLAFALLRLSAGYLFELFAANDATSCLYDLRPATIFGSILPDLLGSQHHMFYKLQTSFNWLFEGPGKGKEKGILGVVISLVTG